MYILYLKSLFMFMMHHMRFCTNKEFYERKCVIIFSPINLNMCFGCSKEPSHWDGSFEYPQHMFWMRNKETSFPIHTLIWRHGYLLYGSGEPEHKCICCLYTQCMDVYKGLHQNWDLASLDISTQVHMQQIPKSHVLAFFVCQWFGFEKGKFQSICQAFR